MVTKPLTESQLSETVRAEAEYGNQTAAAESLGIHRTTFQHRLKIAKKQGVVWPPTEPFETDELPDEIDPVELLERRKRQFLRKTEAEEARRLIEVRIKIKGPIGIAHFGDPHVDDDGTDLPKLEKHTQICRDTEGLFAANVGDLHNNWIGRLARLYGEQSTSAAEAWALVEWLMGSVDWLYLIGGNHDCWSGAGDPLKWITKHKGVIFEPWGARLNLVFPNGKQIRINARHDFTGHSMWNPAHGVAKAVQMGWRDHISTCGHKHISGYQLLKDPSSGLISHAIRVAGYKTYDRFAKERGLPNQNICPTTVTIIDPRFEDDDPRLITTLFDVEEASEFLTWKRSRC
ncbi:MAG TPA: hypothetical protein ENH62_09015 [Marinobacter sp.]|uniref:Uncharacterized protein n=1 Tax=marine sediment metagenome TaxID=412755 RepID=A0A0F9L6H4_9ZZZZ|nr:hypothetical protein [Marinobacter sp.]